MTMLIRIVDVDALQSTAVETAVNDASEALAAEGRFVVGMRFRTDWNDRNVVVLEHMADEHTDTVEKAVEAENALQRIVDRIKPETQPDEESYDDTESAYGNGMAVANWEAAVEIEAVLARLRA